MKFFRFFLASLLIFALLGTTVSPVQAQTKPQKEKKGWSRKAKGAAIGAGAGVVGGALLGGTKGAIIGGAAGTVAGGAIGRNKDKKKDPERYRKYKNN